MEYNHDIWLVTIETSIDEFGDQVEGENLKRVLASKIDYRNKDYYEALKGGLRPSITFGINKHDYDNEKLVRYDTKDFKIIDVYPIKEKNISEFESLGLICEEVI